MRLYSSQEIETFELRHRVKLPDSFRTFLIERGAGRKISLLEEWCQPDFENELPAEFLSRPFPHVDAWNDRSLLDDRGWFAPYFDHLLACGAMRITNMGGEQYNLLIVSGAEAGNVWCDDRACNGTGIYPLKAGNRRRVHIDDYLKCCWRLRLALPSWRAR